MKIFPDLDQAGQSFGKLTFTVTSLNGLGLNPSDILSGKAQGPLESGTRLVMDIHGEFTSDELQGTVSASDYANVIDGKVLSNMHGNVVVEGGEKIALRILAETQDNEMKAEIKLRNYGTYASINEKTLLARGACTPGGTTTLSVYHVTGVTEPLFKDPDLSTVDYANFPFTLEGLQANKDAVSVYSGQGTLNGADSFGVDTMAVFGGQVPIPEEGVRINGFFAGPCAGGVNGVISGRNFLWVTPDGQSHMNSKIIVRTLEGDTLLVEAQGASFPQTGAAWFETSRTVSNLPKYADAARRFNVGVGSTDVQTREIVYNHFSLAENPFP